MRGGDFDAAQKAKHTVEAVIRYQEIVMANKQSR